MTVQRLIFVSLLAGLVSACASSSFSGSSGKAKAKEKEEEPQPKKPAADANPISEQPEAEDPQKQEAADVTQPPADAIDQATEGDFQDRLGQHQAQTGAIQVSLLWDTTADLDLHVFTAAGEHIYFIQKQDTYGGFLDVDFIPRPDGSLGAPIENVFWQNPPHGRYQIYVKNYNPGAYQVTNATFKVRLKVGDQAIRVFDGTAYYKGPSLSDDKSAMSLVYEFIY